MCVRKYCDFTFAFDDSSHGSSEFRYGIKIAVSDIHKMNE